MGKPPVVHFGGGVLCESVRRSESGAVDCYGVFTGILAWGFPTFLRKWNVVLTAYDVPGGPQSAAVSIVYAGRKRMALGTGNWEQDEKAVGSILHLPVSCQFVRAGECKIEVTLLGSMARTQVPLIVVEQPWPKFSPRELKYLSNAEGIPKVLRATVVCSDCSRPVVFEATPLKDIELLPGVSAFPESGEYMCECGHAMQLRDLEGQTLQSIKTGLVRAMGGS
ncbi:MAG TPA: hypothetical protein VGM19_09430 [Armatimonadota bacterium]|jgi:hypothetical protein